jgi:hypothetical protein
VTGSQLPDFTLQSNEQVRLAIELYKGTSASAEARSSAPKGTAADYDDVQACNEEIMARLTELLKQGAEAAEHRRTRVAVTCLTNAKNLARTSGQLPRSVRVKICAEKALTHLCLATHKDSPPADRNSNLQQALEEAKMAMQLGWREGLYIVAKVFIPYTPSYTHETQTPTLTIYASPLRLSFLPYMHRLSSSPPYHACIASPSRSTCRLSSGKKP